MFPFKDPCEGLDDAATFDAMRRIKLLCMAAAEDVPDGAKRERALAIINENQDRLLLPSTDPAVVDRAWRTRE